MGIKVDENDALWYFYKKAFENENLEYKRPTSVCPYFWTAVYGLLGCWCKTAPLIATWVVGMMVGTFGVGMIIGANNSLFSFLFSAMFGLFLTFAGYIPPFFITGFRLKGRAQLLYKGFWALFAILVFGFILLSISYGLYNKVSTEGLPSPSQESLMHVTTGAGILVGTAVIGMLVTGLIIWTCTKFSATALAKTLYHVLMAFKNRVCPLMEIDPAIEPKPKVVEEEEIVEIVIKNTDTDIDMNTEINPYQSPNPSE